MDEKPTNVNSMCNGKVLRKPQNRQLKNLWWEILRMQNIRIDYSGQITFKMKWKDDDGIAVLNAEYELTYGTESEHQRANV